MSENFIESSIDAGYSTLEEYEVASKSSRPKRQLNADAFSTAVAFSEEPEGDGELRVNYRLNATGNIWYSTTSKAESLSDETKALFNSVSVLLAAMTKAMAQANKSLFDFDDWSKLIRKSGYFIESGKVQKHISIEATTVTVDTQILSQLLPGIDKAPSAMQIGKDILSALNGEYGGMQKKDDAKMAHLLFICEEILGEASVSIRLFFADSKQMELMTKSPCHKSSTESYEQEQRIDTFLFVSPEQISKYAKDFENDDPAYVALIQKLTDSLAD